MSLPLIGVMPEKTMQGANDLSDEVSALTVLPFEEALSTPWSTDAHFVTYLVRAKGHDEKTLVRCNKALLPKIRMAGGELVTSLLVLDYDNPDHAAWTDESKGTFLSRLQDVADAWPMAWDWAALYTTRHGARFVYVLDTPVPVDEAEAHHRWLVQQFRSRDIAIDPTCSDWTRCFRLPFVVRTGTRTWEEEFEFLQQYDRRLAVADLGMADRIKTVTQYAAIPAFDHPKPDPSAVTILLEEPNPESGRIVQTAWIKTAKARLKSRDCYGCLFEHKPLAERGARDATLHRHIGQAIGLLYNVEDTTPQHIYALFLDPVQQLEPDSGTSDWTDVLWDQVGRLWSKEEAKQAAEKSKADQEIDDAVELIDKVLHGMRGWCRDHRLHGDKETALAFVARRLIASLNHNYVVMAPNGRYDSHLLLASQVVPRIRALGMDKIIAVRTQREDGMGWKESPLSSILSDHATIVGSARSQPQIEGGYIEDIDGPDAQLIVPSFRRNDALGGLYDKDVDTWLRMFFGADYDRAAHWLAWSIAFEEGPICALSICGDPGVGKKLLVKGLSECLASPSMADAADLVGDHQYGLLESPFLIVNEGWPRPRSGKHPADQFRALVSGDPMRVQRKFLAPVTCYNPARIIFTANNLDVVRLLTKDRELSPQDREALAIRLLHFNVGSEAATWLRAQGGTRFTGSPGRRWVSGDAGQESDYIVARHLLWLYENRKGPVGSRLLVEGNSNDDLLFEMRTGSGSSPLVIEIIIQLLERQMPSDGLAVVDGKIWVLSSAVVGHYRQHMAGILKEPLTTQKVGNVFRGLMKRESGAPTVLKGREAQGRKRWHEIDAKLLLSVAQRDGWKCQKLEQIVADQEQIEVAAERGIKLATYEEEAA